MTDTPGDRTGRKIGSTPASTRQPDAAGDKTGAKGGHRRARGGDRYDRRQQAINPPSENKSREVYGALDLGTNNCRLLLARPSRRGFHVVDAFSRIIRLGEGVTQTGRLSDTAMLRTIDALGVCAAKMRRFNVQRARLVATEACRMAENGGEFLEMVRSKTGLELEILSRETEARLAVSGCASLIDAQSNYVLVFDIGGGSSEIIWLDLTQLPNRRKKTLRLTRNQIQSAMIAWTSLPVGVVTLAERHGGHVITSDIFSAMVDDVCELIQPFEEENKILARIHDGPMHFLGTSGTVTTLAGVKLGLKRYDRMRVDGYWMPIDEARGVTTALLNKTFDERVAEPCIGIERADLVLAGCAILEALFRTWPCERLRVADRGLREGILTTLMTEDGVFRTGRRRRNRSSQRKNKPPN